MLKSKFGFCAKICFKTLGREISRFKFQNSFSAYLVLEFKPADAMRLTEVFFRWKKRLPRGNIWRGKYRLVKKVTPLATAIQRANYELEEQNMFYLRHPYLTTEQSHGHAIPFNHKQKFIEKQRKEWKDHKLLGDRFGFLKVSDKWE